MPVPEYMIENVSTWIGLFTKGLTEDVHINLSLPIVSHFYYMPIIINFIFAIVIDIL